MARNSLWNSQSCRKSCASSSKSGKKRVIKIMNDIIYRETTEEKKLDRFFMENELEYSEEHPVDTKRIRFWEAVTEDESLAGGLVLALRQDEYIIDGIAVDSSLRGKNIGGELLKLAVSEVKQRGADRIYLVARAPEFFAHFGFVPVKREDAPEFFECLTCPQYGVSCHPEVMRLDIG
jgi:N-acetylglutamate synthase-like GNAT family acetyltransferase